MADGRRLAQLARISVTELRGVGPVTAASLGSLGISSVLDLLTHYPRRYVDRTKESRICELVVGEEALVTGTVRRATTRRTRGGRSLVEVLVGDPTGSLACSFFNQPWRASQLEPGRAVVVFGRVEQFRDRLQMTSPLVDLVGDQTGKLVAIYPQSAKAGIGSPQLAGYLDEVLSRAGVFADPLEPRYRRSLRLLDRTAALRGVHQPDDERTARRARRRLAFDELLRLQLLLVMRKRAAERSSRGIAHAGGAVELEVEPDRGRAEPGRARAERRARPMQPRRPLGAHFLATLPFPLTATQVAAIAEIERDLRAPVAMHRLLQGDVGSGKTIVALCALLISVEGGHQGALMAPTTLLAEQHHLVCRRLLEPLSVEDPSRITGRRPLEVALLTNRTGAAERARVLAALAAGQCDIVVGTHSLLHDDVRFSSLGVVVIDEQQRFGVEQRAALRRKGEHQRDGEPDVLVMTATPIPRTAAMTVYGDLDQTVLDALPPGRRPVRTIWSNDVGGAAAAFAAVRAELDAGRQAYVVCARVSEAPNDAPGDALVPDGDATRSGASPALVVRDEDDVERELDADADAEPGGTARPAARGAIEEALALGGGELAGYRLGVVHGRLAPGEREAVMDAFRRGDLQVLVATTVIEVGVDVANATVMVVEDADRFGLAQLHQLRGRVGRGSAASSCYLLSGEVRPEAAERLLALVRSNDGFELAEVDLTLRGEGTLLGTRQKGVNDLKLASLRRDRDLIEAARSVAIAIVEDDERLERHPVLAEELQLFLGDEEEARYLFQN